MAHRSFKGTFLQSSLGSSRLVRLLGPSTPPDAGAPRHDFAESLSRWVNAFDALKLQSAHQQVQALSDHRAPVGRRVVGASLDEQFRRVRASLAKAIEAPAQAGLPGEAGEASHRQRCLELQRQMEMKIAALRVQVRQALSAASPRLHQLAVLDAAMEETLAEREQKLLSTVPALLERRVAQLRKRQRDAAQAAQAAAQADGATSAADTPSTTPSAAEARADFTRHLHEVLLAELDLRLQPVLGLIEAFHGDTQTNA
jgi:hypothetical protein